MAQVVEGAAAVAPLDVAQVAARFERITAMIEAGHPRAARRELAALVAAADDATAALLLSCLQALERPRVIAVARLRRLWADATDDGRALVEACVPRGPALPPARVAGDRPAVPVRRGPVSVPVTRQGPASGPRDPRAAGQARDAARYFGQDAATGGIEALAEDDDHGSDYPFSDEEAGALVPASGTLCVACWIERPTREQRAAADDGLCGECRDHGAPGIVVPAGADRATRTRARCRYIADRAASRDAARALLRGEYRRARGADKRTIVDWVDHHLPT